MAFDLHENCLTGWLVFIQPLSHLHGGFGEPRTTGDAYTEEADALRNAEALSSAHQATWVKRIRLHNHR